ncbi:hypothetical protein OFM41_25755 [Escherichia coli]|nr:hypothetical protein [Escherichia coli]
MLPCIEQARQYVRIRFILIFDNDEDKTDSAALLPCIEQARQDVRTLRQLQLQHQNR